MSRQFLEQIRSLDLGIQDPVETEIAEVPTILVDSHNLVLPSWMRYATTPAAVMHIDHHADMDAGVITQESISKNGQPINLNAYAQAISIAGFISAAMYYNSVGAVYWYDPRNDMIAAYGRVKDGKFINTPKLQEINGRINWILDKDQPMKFSPSPQLLTLDEAIADLQGFNGIQILDTDLDAFSCIVDPEYPEAMYRTEREEFSQSSHNLIHPQFPLTNEQYEAISAKADARIETTTHLLGQLSKPNLISIARSETPQRWTPKELARPLQTKTMQAYTNLYTK